MLLTALVLELGWPESPVRVFLRSVEARPPAGIVAAGAFLGLLALSKLNYIASLVFVAYLLLWLRSDAPRWTRLLIPVTVAVLIALPWSVYHAWVNDFQTGARVIEHAEKVAAPEMKPSAYASATSFPFLALQAKGVPLSFLLTRLDWLGLSFRSFSGLYGWMDVVAVPWVYRLVSAAAEGRRLHAAVRRDDSQRS